MYVNTSVYKFKGNIPLSYNKFLKDCATIIDRNKIIQIIISDAMCDCQVQ